MNVGIAAAFVPPLATGMVQFPETPPEGPTFSAWSREGWFEARARMFVEQDDLERAGVTARAAREAGFASLADRLSEEIASGVRRREALGEAERARALLDGGHEVEGMEALKHAAALDSTNGRIWLWIADRRRLAGDFTGAESDLKRGRAATSDAGIQAEAALILGMLEVDRSQPMVAAERFREVQRWSPKRADGYLYEACARAARGDPVGAREALHRGLRRLPGQADLTALLASIPDTP